MTKDICLYVWTISDLPLKFFLPWYSHLSSIVPALPVLAHRPYFSVFQRCLIYHIRPNESESAERESVFLTSTPGDSYDYVGLVNAALSFI